MIYQETAYAKINLALHVRARRDDGYHELESVVAFLDSGDVLQMENADADSLSVTGEFAHLIGTGPDNLVLRALEFMRIQYGDGLPPLRISLTKNLPVAAGIGGGSADAAAIIRMLRSDDDDLALPKLAAAAVGLGADVPVCVHSTSLIMRGIGADIVHCGDDDSISAMPCLLVNPRVPVSTAAIFRNWDRVDHGGLSGRNLRYMALSGRNDLQAAAIAHCPVIADVLAQLENTHPVLARMSGSGATCFALFDDMASAQAAEAHIRATRPDWWLKLGRLR